MGWTYIGATRATATNSDASLSASPDLNVAAGDLLVAICNWNGAVGATPGVRTGVGVNDFAMRTTTDLTDHHIVVGYKIGAVEDATATLEFTLSAARTYRTVIVLQYRPDAGETVTLEDAATVATGTAYLFSSNYINPAGDDLAVIGLVGLYTGRAIDPTFNIGGSAATLPFAVDYYEAHTGYRLLTSAPGSIDCDIELAQSSQYAIELLAFKSATAAGGGAAEKLRVLTSARWR